MASDLHISIVRALLDLQANIGINDHLVIANGLQKDYLQKNAAENRQNQQGLDKAMEFIRKSIHGHSH